MTPVDADAAKPLIEGMSTETAVTDPSGIARFGLKPRWFEQALGEALAE